MILNLSLAAIENAKSNNPKVHEGSDFIKLLLNCIKCLVQYRKPYLWKKKWPLWPQIIRLQVTISIIYTQNAVELYVYMLCIGVLVFRVHSMIQFIIRCYLNETQKYSICIIHWKIFDVNLQVHSIIFLISLLALNWVSYACKY